MEDLSPFSDDSGLHSLSSPSSPLEIFEQKPTTEEPPAKRQRQEDARVPAVSRECSEETVSSDDTGVLLRLEDKRQPFCEPSTSKTVEEVETEKDVQTASSKTEQAGCKSANRCQWDECDHVAANIDHLYDHVMEAHLREVSKRTVGHEDELECLWGDCSMSIVRGDWNKKLKWLEDHYRIRHAKNAQTVRCVIENCTFRCSTLCKLDEHVRWKHMHIEETDQLEEENEHKKKAEEEDFSHHKEPLQLLQDKYLFDWYYEDVLLRRNKRALELNFECEWVQKKQPGRGAKRRKTRALLTGEWAPIKQKEEERLPRNDDGEKTKTNLSLTLEDLFPGWGHKSIITQPEEDSDSSDDDFPTLERVSPLPHNTLLEDCLPPLMPHTSSEDDQDWDSSSLPSLDRYYESDQESECFKCLESILDRLI